MNIALKVKSLLLILLFICTNSVLADEVICSAPLCKIYNITSVDGTKLVVNDWGAAFPKKPAILFLHGIPHDQSFWKNQINSSLRVTNRIITMDLRGHGLSDKPEVPTMYTKQKFAEDINAVLTAPELNIKSVVLVGSSFGGIPIESYLNVYGTGNNMVKGIVLVDATADSVGESFLTPAAVGDLVHAAFDPLTSDGFRDANQSFISLCFANPIDKGLNNFLLLNDMVTPQPPRQALIIAGQSNLGIVLNPVPVKTLIIWGENDNVLSLDGAYYLKNNISGSKLVIIPNTGHLPMLESPNTFNRLICNFVNGSSCL